MEGELKSRQLRATACEIARVVAVYLFLNSLTKLELEAAGEGRPPPRLTACVPSPMLSHCAGLSASGPPLHWMPVVTRCDAACVLYCGYIMSREFAMGHLPSVLD